MYSLDCEFTKQSWQLTLLILIALPVVVYFGKRFENGAVGYTDVMMKEHQEADTVSEETFRNCKTVASLGARSKIYSVYDTIVELRSYYHI